MIMSLWMGQGRIRPSGPVLAGLMLLFCGRAALSQDDIVDGLSNDVPFNGSGSLIYPDDAFGYGTQVWASYSGGDGIANDQSFTSLGVLKPLINIQHDNDDETLFFVDGRLAIQNDADVAGNIGFVYRRYFAGQNRVWGLHAFYDVDDTRRSTFHQMGAGLESFGDICDFAVNGYLPTSDKRQAFGFSPVGGTPMLSGRNIFLERFRFDEVAMRGVDAEIGIRVPGQFAADHDVRAFVGWYHFEQDDAPDVDGVSGRIQGNVAKNMQLYASITGDDEFDTNVIVGVIWEFTKFFSQPGPAAGDVRGKLGQLVRRNQNVVIVESRVSDPVAVSITDPVSGQPIAIVHVDSGAPGGGDGSVEDPLQSLSEISAQSLPGDIILIYADSIFDGEWIALQENQQFIGEGAVASITTEEHGTIQLPAVSGGMNAPIIRNSPATGAAVTLADGTSVIGFTIEDSLGPAIAGDGVSGPITISHNTITNTADQAILANQMSGAVTISDNTIDGAMHGLDIRNSTGTFTIDSTPISNTTDEGILLADNAAGSSFAFTGTTSVDNAGGTSISIQGGGANMTFSDVEITNRNSTAIGINRSTGSITFTEPLTLSNPNGAPEETIGISNSSGAVTFGDVTIDDTDRAAPGLASIMIGGNDNEITFGDVNIQTNDGGGISAYNNATITITGGTIVANGGPGVIFNGITGLDATFESVSSTNTTRGIELGNMEGNFVITGTGAAGSGGTIQSTGTGIWLNNAENALFNFMDVDSATFGVLAFNTDSLLVNTSSFTGATDGWTGIGVFNDDEDNDGTPVVLVSNTITSAANNTFGINFLNDGSPQGVLTIDDHLISLTGTGTVGIRIEALDDDADPGPGDILLQNQQNNNTVFTPSGQEFIWFETLATIFDRILVNGVPVP